jgi:hypothetical protein
MTASRSNASSSAGDRIIIGWREYVGLPDWNIPRIMAKADTGARISAIDVGHIEELGEDRIRFDVATDRKHLNVWTTVEATIKRRTRIKSSFGDAHERYVVETRCVIGPVERMIELSLVCRARMHCRMLLGRLALAPDILVDSGQMYRFGRKSPRRSESNSRKQPS